MPNTLPSGLTVPCFTVAGPVQIWASTGAANAMQLLGWTRGGIEINERPFMPELRSDASGGPEGPPQDFLYLGEMHSVTAELGQFDVTILAKLARRMNASIASRVPGTVVNCAGGAFRVLFLATGFVRNYTKVFITEPIQWPSVGSPASFPRIVFTCLGDSGNTDGLPWNTTYTAGTNSVT